MTAIGRATMPLLIIALCGHFSAASAQQNDGKKEAPIFQNAHLFAVIGPVSRSSDGFRINLPLEFTSTKVDEDLYLGVTDAYKVGAIDNNGARCGFSTGIDAAGISVGVIGLENATLVSPGSNLVAIFSLACNTPSNGDSFSVSAEFILFVGKEGRPQRFSVGARRVMVVNQRER